MPDVCSQSVYLMCQVLEKWPLVPSEDICNLYGRLTQASFLVVVVQSLSHVRLFETP